MANPEVKSMSADRIDAVAEGERVLADYYGGGSPTYEQSAIMKACIRDLLAALASQKEDKRYSRFLAERSARLTAEADLARVRADYDALRKAVYPNDDGTWTTEQVCSLAQAHYEDSQTMDGLDADGSIEGGVRKLKADYDVLQKRQDVIEQGCEELARHYEDEIAELQAATDAADAQCAELRKYAQHSTTCPCQPYEAAPSKAQRIAWPSGPPNCTCGLADLLAPPQKDNE